MDKSKNSKQEINLNPNNNNKQQKKNFENKFQNEKEETNEIIIELIIFNEREKNEIYILCDKKKLNEDYYKNNINTPKEFNYFNKDNTKLYLNDKEIKFIIN